MFDVCIVGAGIVGLALARKLSRYDLAVCVVEKEKDVAMGATKANSAIVHGGYAESNSKLKGRLCYKGRVQFEQLNQELSFGFTQTGSLVITTDEEDLPKLEKMRENGILNGLTDLSILGHDEIMQLEPNINPEVKYALYCAGAGVCSPYEMAIALAENAIANGVKLFLEEPVTAIQKQGDSFAVSTPKQTIDARFVVNCAGIHSADISEMVNESSFTIRPRTGEYLLFARGTGEVLNTVVFQMPSKMGKGILATSTYYGNLLLGPDAINEDGEYNRSTHVERLAEIYREAKKTTEHMDINKFLRSFTGVRAVSSTDDFIIEQSATPGFINAAGIQSPGVTASPAIADRITEILQEAGLSLVEKADFNPIRKPIVEKKPLRPFAEIAPLIEGESRPEKIICRCEQVTEAQIVDCLHRGVRVTTVDGVKRRTRASMGLCQGNFCRNRFKEIMEREYGMSIDGQTDVEMENVSRVQKKEFIDYIKGQNQL